MTAAAALCSLVWFATAFVLRIAVQLRRTGDSGLRFRAATPVAAVAKAGFIAASVLVGVAPVLALVGWFGAIGWLDAGPLRVLGLALALLGILGTFVAQLEMGRSWRIGVDPSERTELVTSGLFALVRNPIFTTMALTAVGVLLAAPTGPGLAGLVLTLLTLQVQVRGVEEPYLRRTHGPAYADYESRVGRFLPAVGVRAGRA
jgi:protein-S-isoprenylcysteine O-methyltransferase Ste14